MAQIAAVLGKTVDAAKYRKLFARCQSRLRRALSERQHIAGGLCVHLRNSPEMDDADALSRGNLQVVDYGTIMSAVFNTELFTPTQTAYVLALHFDLLPDDLRPPAVAELVADLERREMHFSTGFVGSPYLPHVLSGNGRLDTAYALLKQTSWPSWLYAVTQGATTIWERWDGWTQENGFQTPDMNSFNHYAYGAIGAWLYNTVAGIEVDPCAPGYKHMILRPQPGGGLRYARAALDTLYGMLVSDWELENSIFEYTVTVPPNTTATVHLPHDGHVTLNGEVASGLVHELGAGTYRFIVG